MLRQAEQRGKIGYVEQESKGDWGSRAGEIFDVVWKGEEELFSKLFCWVRS